MSYTLNRTGEDIDAIGTMQSATGSLASLPDSTNTTVVSLTLTAGTWLVYGKVVMRAGAGGFLTISISTTNNALAAETDGIVTVPANFYSRTQVVRALTISASQPTVYLVARQTSGSALDLPESPRWRAIRLR